jgi:hypothetical protein
MDATANAGMSAMGVPEQGQTRGGNAAVGAVGSLGGSALGGLAKGPVTSAAYQSFLDLADKILPANLKSLINYGPALSGLHYVAPHVAHTIDAAVGALGVARTNAARSFATGETAAQKYLQSRLPSTIEYLSQVGSAAADSGTGQ